MKILVCISHVPDTTTKIAFDESQTVLINNNIQYIINPYDELALSKAVDLIASIPDSTVTVLTVGDASTEPTIRKALAIGATQAVRIDTAPKDAWQVAHEIANYAKEQQFDLILTGRESIDYNGGQVAAIVAELLHLPSIALAKSLTITDQKASIAREIEGGKEILEISLPIVVSVAEGIAEAKIPNMRGIMSARSKPLDIRPATDTQALVSYSKYEQPNQKAAAKMLATDQLDELVEFLVSVAK